MTTHLSRFHYYYPTATSVMFISLCYVGTKYFSLFKETCYVYFAGNAVWNECLMAVFLLRSVISWFYISCLHYSQFLRWTNSG